MRTTTVSAPWRRFFSLGTATAVACLAAAAASLLVAAGSARAVTARDILIKAPGQESSVYYLASNGKRYVFPNEGTYYSWYSDFSSLVEVPFAELVSYPLGGNVTYRPGFRMVKITTDPKVYAVDKSGVLRWITSETMARRLYGTDWNRRVHDVPDEFFTNYAIGSPIYTDTDFSPVAKLAEVDSIGEDKSLAVSADADLADTDVDDGDAETIRSQTPPPAASSSSNCSADTWECGNWSACTSGGTQTRACTKTFDCDAVSTPSPAVSQSCTPASAQTCDADVWECGNWSACSVGGNQTRTCTLTFDCPSINLSSPATSQSCTPPPAVSPLAVAAAGMPTSATVEQGDTNVAMLGFSLTAGASNVNVASFTIAGLIDGNNDGTYARGSDGGASFAADVAVCRLYEGGTQVGESRVPGADGLIPIMDFDGLIDAGTTWTLVVKCDISATAGQHKVALTLARTTGVVPIVATGTGITLFGDGITGLPVNPNGTTTADVKMTIAAPQPPAYTGPTISLIALQTSTLSTGDVTALRFSVAAGTNKVSIKHLTAHVIPTTANAVAVAVTTGSSVRRIGEGTNIPGGARVNFGSPCLGNSGASCPIEIGFTTAEDIMPGEARNYELRLNVSGSLSMDDSIATKLEAEGGATATGQLTQSGGAWDYRVETAGDNFVWSDNSADPHSDALAPAGSADWSNGVGVHGLPTENETMIKM